VLKYDNHKLTQALTRGSGYEGEIITCAAKMIKNLPDTIPYGGYVEIRGEALIPWKYYNEMNSDGSMGHPRNVASGGLRQLNANETAKRNIYFYAFTLVNWKDLGVSTKMESLKFLSDNGFDVVPHMRCVGSKQTHDTIIALDRERYENPTDGWIVEFNDLSYGESLGSTGHHDRKMFALKPQAEEYETYFRGIEYKTCRTGVVSMTALFDPVEIGNTVVSRATLHNCDFFNSLELGRGDVITVTKFNEIIPGIMDNETRTGS
jgi:DNA ligase (NAD+)